MTKVKDLLSKEILEKANQEIAKQKDKDVKRFMEDMLLFDGEQLIQLKNLLEKLR